MIKKILLAAAILLPARFASAQTVKIGLVDTNAVIAAMPETTAAQTKLAESTKKYEDEYAKLGEEMKRMYDELNNMKSDELQAIKDRKTREFTDYQQKMQTFEQTAAQDLQKMQQELMAPIVQKVQQAITSVGQEGGYSLIQDANPQIVLFHASPVVDVTADVKAKLGIK